MHATVRLPGGALIAVDPTNLEIYTGILTGRWDAHVARVSCDVVRPGDVFYDIGANSGVMSLEVCQQHHGDVHVYSFEPQPSLAKTIAVSARLNGFNSFHVLSTLLGEQSGRASLFIPQYSVHASVVSRAKSAQQIDCPVETLDGLIASNAILPPSVIKIDVEGAELDVFRGGTEMIRRHRPKVLFESDVNSERFGYTRRELCEFLDSLGHYRFDYITADGLEPVDGQYDDTRRTDVLATPI